MVRETWVQSQVESYQRLKKKWYLIPPCLTLNNIRYVSSVKWSNSGKGVAPSPTPWCSSYWKGSLLVILEYGRQHVQFSMYVFVIRNLYHTHTHTHPYIYIYIYTHLKKVLNISNTHARTHICIKKRLESVLYIYTHMHIRAHTYTNTHIYIPVYTSLSYKQGEQKNPYYFYKNISVLFFCFTLYIYIYIYI